MAALCVAQEKESRSWPVLLCTPLPDIWILRHKALAVIVKNAAGWMSLLIVNAGILILTCTLDQQALPNGQLVQYAVSSLIGIFASLYMLTGTGLYFSIRMRTGTLAVTMTLGFVFVYYIILRSLLLPVLFRFITPQFRSFYIVYMFSDLVIKVLIGVVMFKLAAKGLRRHIV